MPTTEQVVEKALAGLREGQRDLWQHHTGVDGPHVIWFQPKGEGLFHFDIAGVEKCFTPGTLQVTWQSSFHVAKGSPTINFKGGIEGVVVELIFVVGIGLYRPNAS